MIYVKVKLKTNLTVKYILENNLKLSNVSLCFNRNWANFHSNRIILFNKIPLAKSIISALYIKVPLFKTVLINFSIRNVESFHCKFWRVKFLPSQVYESFRRQNIMYIKSIIMKRKVTIKSINFMLKILPLGFQSLFLLIIFSILIFLDNFVLCSELDDNDS